MIAFTTILHPTDLSDAGRPALRYASTLADWYGSTLRVLHVVPGLDAATPAGTPPSRAAIVEVVRTAVGAELANVSHDISVEVGAPARVILDQVKDMGADLVVLGTHGRSGFDRLVHGSVAERVIGNVGVPVLAVPPGAVAADHPSPLFGRILCAMDFSPAALRALDHAVDLARQSNGFLTVLHVVEYYPEDVVAIDTRFDVDGFRRELVRQAQQRLDDLVAGFSQTWVRIDAQVAVGRPYRRVLEQAKSTGADLVVVGAQGNAGLDLALFGSTAREVLRQASCPILVIRDRPAPDA